MSQGLRVHGILVARFVYAQRAKSKKSNDSCFTLDAVGIITSTVKS